MNTAIQRPWFEIPPEYEAHPTRLNDRLHDVMAFEYVIPFLAVPLP